MYRILCDSYVLYDPRLPDLFVFEPELTQKKNEPGELTFKMPKEHPHYDQWVKLFDEAVDAEERSYCASLLMRNPTTNTRY